MSRISSPYSAAITGGGFLFDETDALLPLLQSENASSLLAEEALHNNVLHINAETSRKKAILEIRRRYASVPAGFWKDYQQLSRGDRMVALFYVILKTYKILFDFHVNVAMRKWNSVSRRLEPSDLTMEFYEIAARDPFVDSWSETTRRKIVGAYLTILRRVGMLDSESHLRQLNATNFDYYLRIGEPWFLEAALLEPYQIEQIKKQL